MKPPSGMGIFTCAISRPRASGFRGKCRLPLKNKGETVPEKPRQNLF